MRWKQFFTPVESINAEHAKKMIREKEHGSYTLLDVRQPAEYEAGHLPAAKLIPLPQLKERLHELDPEKPTVVYCAVGGRSRVAAQMLAGKNFSEVYNLSGGFKGWHGNVAAGREDQGLDLFTGRETPEEVLLVAYSLEKGLRDFYRKIIPATENSPARDLFQKLAGIELNHQKRIFNEYCRITGIETEIEKFDREIVAPAMEGGIDTEEYMQRYGANVESTAEVVDMAMSIEAQALDLYSRAADNAADSAGSEALQQIAREEQEHLTLLGELLDRM
ncbi:MAG: rhodanese-like domain-containing protein [Desulfobulbaceae bacterium]|nr:rhodanese-like domain-containing protein [Desulfobulbaceae bacterium]